MVMKLTFLLCVTCVYSSFANVYSQEKVNINMGETTIKELLSEFQRQTQRIVIYNDDNFKADRKVSGKYTDMDIDQFMASVLKGSGMSYRVEKDYILIVPGSVNGNLASAQQSKRTVKGSIIDKDGEPLPGVTVLVKGTTVGVSSDIDGKFTLSMPAEMKTLVVSFVGMKTQEVSVDGKNEVTVKLEAANESLDEVVVVGYNSVKKSQMTGAVDVVKGNDLAFESSPTLESRLQGKVPGVMIISGSGQPGSDDLQIRVRGTGSISGSNTPLYIMDGVMVEPGQFASLNPNDIADMQVLKDASATAIYGSRGANGVFVITTKKGKAGQTHFNYRNQFGFSNAKDFVDMMDSEENIKYQTICVTQKPGDKSFPLMPMLEKELKGQALTADEQARLDMARATNTNWFDEMTRTGFLTEHDLSASGGNEKTKFFVSASYLNQNGILKKSNMDRISGRLNLDHEVNKYINFGVKLSLGYSKVNFSDPKAGEGRNGWSNPWFTARLAYPYESPEGWYNGDNPTLITKYYEQKLNKLKLIGSTYLNVNITDWISVKTNFGMDYMNNKRFNYLDREHPKAVSYKGSMYQMMSDLARYTWTNTVNVNKTFNERHTLNAVAGMEMFQGKWYTFDQTGYNVNPSMSESPAGIGDKVGSSDNRPRIGGGRTVSNLLSYFAQASYSLDNKYSIAASLRYDESSKFQGSNKSAVFWSLGASWNMRSEDFMQNLDWMDMLKFRVSYGTTGNQDGISDFGTYDGYGNVSYNGESGYVHSQIGNPALKWETSAQTNAGFDFSLFESRLSGTIDYYYIKTKDLYMDKKISTTSGFSSITTNAGSIANQGIEVSLNGDVLRKPDFTWSIGLNFTYNRNKILDLGTWKNAEGKFQNGDVLYEEGKPLGTWSMVEWAGVNPETGEVWFYDGNGGKTEEIANAPKVDNFKSSEIPYFGGFNTNLRYKGLSLSLAFTYAYDFTVMNASKWYLDNHSFNGNKPKYMLTMWQKPGDVTNVARFDAKNNPSPWASQFLEDASYLKLKNVRLTYQLPERWMKKTHFFDSFSVYAQAENVWTLTNYTGADPEVNGSTDYMSYPKPFTMTFGMDINF